MKIKIKDLNPNPFKKEINKGKLSEETITKIKSNIKELGLMGTLPVFKKEGKYFLISGHHRLETLKREFGKDFEVEIKVHDYTDDQVLRGMIVENLTQRDSNLKETADNLALIRKYLMNVQSPNNHVKKKDSLGRENRQEESGSIRNIHSWLNKNGEVLSIGRISECLSVYDNLSPELLSKVKKTQASSAIERDEALQETQAIYLSKIKDKEEQSDLAESLKRSEEQRVREQGKLMTAYKEASEETKQKVRSQEIDIKEVPVENLKENIKKKIDEEKEKNKGKITVIHFKQFERESENLIGHTNTEIYKTCAFLSSLVNRGIIQSLSWKTMLNLLEAGDKGGKNYSKFMNQIMEEIK